MTIIINQKGQTGWVVHSLQNQVISYSNCNSGLILVFRGEEKKTEKCNCIEWQRDVITDSQNDNIVRLMECLTIG